MWFESARVRFPLIVEVIVLKKTSPREIAGEVFYLNSGTGAV